jgi:trigger factor
MKTSKLGDTVKIDFVGYLDGKPFKGGAGEDYPLKLGSKTFVPGFEEQLIGKKEGEEADVNITFPANYYPNLAGKAVVFKVKIREIK